MCSSAPAPAPTSTSQTTSNIPDWAIPTATKNLGKAEALTDINQNPYQQYQGQRVAGFNPLQTQAMGSIQNMQASPAIGAGMGIAGAAGMGSLNAGSNYNRMATDPGAMQAFMSPYQQNVTDFQKQQAVMDYGRQLPGMGAAASKSGAFGGSRQAIVESEGQRNLQNTLAGIQATGSQNAFQQAQQAQQYGAGLGLQGYGQANQVAQGLGALGMQNYQQNMGIAQAQQQAGAQVQAQEQQGLSNQYQDFLNQQNYPYKQLGFMSDIIRGTPTSGGAQSMYQAPPSGISQFAGLAGGLGSLYGGYNQANKVAAGGEIKGYAEGGAVAFDDGGIVPLPNAAESFAAQRINGGKDTVDKVVGMGMDLRGLLAASAQLKKQTQEDTIRKLQNELAKATGMPEQQNTTVKEDVSNMLRQEVESRQGGIADLDTGRLYPQRDTDNLAGGGIVAFEDGGDVRHFQTAGAVSGNYNAELRENPDSLDWRKPPTPLAPAEEAALQKRIEALKRPDIDIGGLAREVGAVPGNIGKSMLEGLGLKNLVNRNAPAAEAPVPADPTRGVEIQQQHTLSDDRSGAPAPSTSPLVSRPSGYAAPSGAPAADSADSGYTGTMKTLAGDRAKAIAMMESGQRTPETVLTAGEYARKNREEEDALLKAQGLLTSAESMKERLANLATAGREARNNRDVDRWMAAAQGFFAMAGGKSQYAMQNMADGLNIGVKELRAVEQDYRKIDQLQKDKAELLKEAARQEVRGDLAKGQTLRKEAEDRNGKIADIQLRTGAHLLETFDRAAATATTAEAMRQTRADNAALRAQQGAIAAQQSRERAAELEAGRTERAKVTADQKYADMQVRLERQHPLILKGELPSKLTALGDARVQLATNPKDPKFIKNVDNLTAEVDRMQDQVANDTAKKAKQFIKAGNSEWGTLQTSGGTK
jgi:hypothetical protein